MADVQHLCRLGRVSKFIIENPHVGVVRAIVIDDEGAVADIREFADTAPVSMITGVSRDTEGPSVVCAWGYIKGRAVKVNTLVRKAIDAMPKAKQNEGDWIETHHARFALMPAFD